MGNTRIRKLDFIEIQKRWVELKRLSEKALNDEKNINPLGDRFEVAMSRFFLYTENDIAQVWITEENGKECYLCLTFIGNSAMTQDKGMTLYSAVKFENSFVRDKQSHWLKFLETICEYAKFKNCKKISFESDLEYFHKLFKRTPMPWEYTARNALRIRL
jgi:hypothetical protein